MNPLVLQFYKKMGSFYGFFIFRFITVLTHFAQSFLCISLREKDKALSFPKASKSDKETVLGSMTLSAHDVWVSEVIG